MVMMRTIRTKGRYICPHCGADMGDYKIPDWVAKLDIEEYLKFIFTKMLSAKGEPVYWRHIAIQRKYASEHVSRLRAVIRQHNLPYSIPPGLNGHYILYRVER